MADVGAFPCIQCYPQSTFFNATLKVPDIGTQNGKKVSKKVPIANFLTKRHHLETLLILFFLAYAMERIWSKSERIRAQNTLQNGAIHSILRIETKLEWYLGYKKCRKVLYFSQPSCPKTLVIKCQGILLIGHTPVEIKQSTYLKV